MTEALAVIGLVVLGTVLICAPMMLAAWQRNLRHRRCGPHGCGDALCTRGRDQW